MFIFVVVELSEFVELTAVWLSGERQLN
jgi:hypothetical protein